MSSLSLHQVKQFQAEDNSESVPSPSSTAARPRITQQRSIRPTLHNHASTDGSSGQEARRATHATAGTSKPSVPLLNLAKQDGGLQVGFGSAGMGVHGTDHGAVQAQ